jgi:Domain of unknown function (DUF4389)
MQPADTTPSEPYPARLFIDYPDRLDRVTTAFRLIWVIPIAIVLAVLTAGGSSQLVTETGEEIATSGGGIVGGLFVATLLMVLFRQKYPRWWFDFAQELARFTTRIGAYVALLTDLYPSAEEEQAIHLELDYPDAANTLNRGLPLVKWFLAIPHYIVLVFLGLGAIGAIIIAWFAILFTGRYPRGLFEYVVGVGRWALRVQAYGFLLITDRYPPFSLN